MSISALIALVKRDKRLTVLVAFALGLAVMNPFLFLGWQSVGEIQADLEKEELMANIQLMNAQSQYDMDTLQSQLYDLQRDIDELSQSPRLAEEAPSADLFDILAKNAGWNAVTLVSLSSVVKPGIEKIGDNEYRKSEIDVKVEGQLSRITSFLTSMESGAYPSTRFEDISITNEEGGQNWQGALTLVVLSQP